MTTRRRDPLSVVVRYRRNNTYGLHVVLGALETLPPKYYSRNIGFARTEPELRRLIAEGLKVSEHVLVLWSFYSPGFFDAVQELNSIRRSIADQRVIHFAGGVHASAEPHSTLQAGFDLVATGDGEATICSVVQALTDGHDYRGVNGTAYMDHQGRLHRNGQASRESLDRYPAFAHRLNKYNAIEITRGCIYACKFCQTPLMF